MRESKVAIIDTAEEVMVTGTGDLDLRNAAEFSSALQTATSSGKGASVDLRAVPFVDSAILACLIEAAKPLWRQGRRLKILISARSHPLQVLKTLGLDQLMDILPEDKPTCGRFNQSQLESVTTYSGTDKKAL